MKKILLLFVVLFASTSTFILNAKNINEAQLPGMVRNYVKTNYPDAANKKWDFDEKKRIYKVNFQENDRKIYLELSYTGLVLNADEEMSPIEVPGFINDYINLNYFNSILSNVSKKIDSKGLKYYANISYPKGDKMQTKNIVFNEEGKVVKEY